MLGLRLGPSPSVLVTTTPGLVQGDGYEGPGRSPDRADAMVLALSALLLGRQGTPRITGL